MCQSSLSGIDPEQNPLLFKVIGFWPEMYMKNI